MGLILKNTNGNLGRIRMYLNQPAPSFTNTKSTTFDRVDEYATTTLSLAKTAYPNISLSCWVKMTKTGLATFTDYQPLSVYVQFYPNSSPIRIYTDSLKRAFVLVQGQAGTAVSTTDLSNGSWHHILQTCQYDAGGTICNVYVNGVQEITNNLWLNYTEATGNLNIGSLNGTTWLFKGNIDEISVYSRILNSTERTALYNAGVPNDLTSLTPIAWYRMGDGDTSPTLINYGSTGTSKNATMVNMDNTNFVNDVP
jgi:hypothetical protein